ncbi:MAG: hypothetical protein ACI9LN_003980 [Saprospiraceae bacterium]|jgi:hypothetical protein
MNLEERCFFQAQVDISRASTTYITGYQDFR